MQRNTSMEHSSPWERDPRLLRPLANSEHLPLCTLSVWGGHREAYLRWQVMQQEAGSLGGIRPLVLLLWLIGTYCAIIICNYSIQKNHNIWGVLHYLTTRRMRIKIVVFFLFQVHSGTRTPTRARTRTFKRAKSFGKSEIRLPLSARSVYCRHSGYALIKV